MPRPDWFVLVEHWVNRGGTGLTLPFLVGARAIAGGIHNAAVENAEQLLGEIFDHPVSGHVAQLTWCENLDAPVIGLNRVLIPGKEFSSTVNGARSVVVRADLVKRWGDTRERIIKGIVDEAREPIRNGLFSRDDGKWHQFTEVERERIARLLAV